MEEWGQIIQWVWGSRGLEFYPIEVWDEVWDRHVRYPKGDLLPRPASQVPA